MRRSRRSKWISGIGAVVLIGGLGLAIDVGVASAVVGPPVLSVNVTNTPTNPVPVTVVANAAAFQPFTASSSDGNLTVVVPSGKMLVIEAVTGYVTVAHGQTNHPFIGLAVTKVGQPTAHAQFSTVSQGTAFFPTLDAYVASHTTKIYALPESTITIGLSSGPIVGGELLFVSGHFENYTP